MDENVSVAERLARIETKIDVFTRAFEKHTEDDHEIFYGNGKPGLVADVQALVGAFKLWRWISGTALGAMAVALAERFFGGK